jgi:hypothetical protein
MAKYVRLKPYNPEKGYVRQRYMRNGRLYDVTKGWYRVDEDVAEELRTVTQLEHDLSERPLDAFDICTEAERKAIDKKEQKEAYEKILKDKGLHPLLIKGAEVPVEDFTTPEAEEPVSLAPAVKPRGSRK